MTKNLGFITLLALSIPTLAQAAPDLDRAMKNPNNWAYPRDQYNNLYQLVYGKNSNKQILQWSA